jgi:ATP synthase protein I
MRKIHSPPANDAWDQTAGDDVIKPLTREEAQALRQQNPAISPWMVLAGQAAGGVLSAFAAWWVSGKAAVGWSVMYGAMAVVIPGALFARGLLSKVSTINPATAVTGFFLWEMVKIGLVLAMLYAAPRLINDLSWPAMLVGLVVTMKVVWLVLWLEARARRKSNKLSAV